MINKLFSQAFCSETFAINADKVVLMLQDHLESMLSAKKKVLETTDWESILHRCSQMDTRFTNNWDIFLREVIQYSQHLHHPHYIGHQVAVPLPMAAIIDLLSSFLNNSTAIVEMGPMHSAIEVRIVEWMAKKIGYSNAAGGFITAGGSLGNLMALLAARQIKAGYDVWNEGIQEPLSVLVSSEAHYCVKRATQIMGLGQDGAIPISSNNDFQITRQALEIAYQEALKKYRKVIAVVGSCCNTGPGTFENLRMIADFCEEHDLWFHVDGAHGAPVVLSKKYQYLAQEIHRADSVVWDLHKMMMMPSLCTGVIFRDKKNSHLALRQQAPYLYSENNDEHDWHAISRRTMECTKPSMALKAYFCLRYYGEDFFEKYIDHTFAMAQHLANLIIQTPCFELAIFPQGNIVCFRFIPEGFDGNIDELQCKICKNVVQSGVFYIVSTTLKNHTYLRTTIMNPFTTEETLQNLLDYIQKC